MIIPTCHPDRKHYAGDLCQKCYKEKNYEQHKERARQRSRDWYKNNRERALVAASNRREANGGAYMKKWRAENRDRTKKSQRDWVDKNAEHVANYDRSRHLHDYLRSTYKMSTVEYQELLDRQNDVCAACKLPCRKNARLSVDHDHTTGLVRGLLCNGCNVALGLVKDDAQILRNLADYLEKHNHADSVLSNISKAKT